MFSSYNLSFKSKFVFAKRDYIIFGELKVISKKAGDVDGIL